MFGACKTDGTYVKKVKETKVRVKGGGTVLSVIRLYL